MKSFILLIPLIFLHTACKDTTTKEDCLKSGKNYKVEKFLNLRTGKNETKIICIDKK